MVLKLSDAEKRAAKFNAAIAALKPLLLAALEAAHEWETLRRFDDGEQHFEMTVELGEIMMGVSSLCLPAMRVINELVHQAMPDDEQEEKSQEMRLN